MTTPEILRSMADEFRAYARAECEPVTARQWLEWAEACEAAAKELESLAKKHT